MKLSELVSDPAHARCDPCAEAVQQAKRRQPPYNRPIEAGRVDGDSRRVVLVENEEGFAEYMYISVDGHLGSVTDDC